MSRHAIDKMTLKRGLVAYFKFDEASWNGTTGEVKDSSIYGNHGTAANSLTTGTDSILGRAPAFDGTDDHINIPTDASIEIAGDLSFSVWVKTSDTAKSFMTMFYHVSPAADSNYSFYIALGKLLYVHGNGTISESLNSNILIADGNWHHVTIVCKYPTCKFYVDGEWVVDETMTFDNVALASSRRISNSVVTTSMVGSLDEMALWNRALQPEEVKDIYNGGIARHLMFLKVVGAIIKPGIVKYNIVEEI